ncbi:MAG: YcfL family protein [Kiritimatiellaeota bacterium]|nr:YcfL family protein [Kiritimatiellota bacterium]
MKYALLILGCVALAGCRTSVNTTEGYYKYGRMSVVEDFRVDTSPRLASRVGVTLINDRIAENGFRQIQIRLTNFTNSRQRVMYQMEWFDESGMRVVTATGGWRDITLEARDSEFINFTPPTERAKDFIFRLEAK